MDNFLLESVLDPTGADVAFSNGWRYGAPVPVGPVTMNDLCNMVPMNPAISLAKLTGQRYVG
jgi:sulfur-oxidizing protein SoxB